MFNYCHKFRTTVIQISQQYSIKTQDDADDENHRQVDEPIKTCQQAREKIA